MKVSKVMRVAVCTGFALGVICESTMAELSLLSSFSLQQSYTTNLFFEDESQREDFGTFLGPNLTLLFKDPDLVIGVTYLGRMSFFANNPDANRYIQNANVILDLPFLTKQYKNLTVSIDESMTFTPQLDAFSLSGAEDASLAGGGNQGFGGVGGAGNIGGANSGVGAAGAAGIGGGIGGYGGGGGTGVFGTRGSSFSNNAGINFGYTWTRRLQASIGYANRYLHFFSKGFQDSLSHIGRTSLTYRLSERTSVIPSYSYSYTKFIGKSTVQGTQGDKIISHNPLLGISHAITPTLSFSVSGGVSFTKQIGASELIQGPGNTRIRRKIPEKFRTRIIGTANLTKQYTQGDVGINFTQTVGNGGGLAAQATRTRAVTGRINHDLSRRMNAFGSVGWAENESLDGNAFDSTTYRIQAGLGYSFTSWLFGNFYYSHLIQSSSGSAATDLNVDQFFLGLTAVADPIYLDR